MSYSNNTNLAKARAKALQSLILDQLPVSVVANKCGVHHSTIWRWKVKWLALNKNVQLTNNNRPNLQVKTYPIVVNKQLTIQATNIRLLGAKWLIPTISSKPHSHPKAISDQTIQLVLQAKRQLKRCAEVVWHHLTITGIKLNGIFVKLKLSLSSVKRILKKHYQVNPRKHQRKYKPRIKRPIVTKPGDLVEVDTIHLFNYTTKKRTYVYTVIDLYTRMAYAKAYEQIRPGLAAKTVLEAKDYFGFNFKVVQTDNGPEFSSYFEQRLNQHNIVVRHTRLGRPNDNAHIERFNRTIQEECTGSYRKDSQKLTNLNQQIAKYLDYYNYQRVHLGLELMVPAEMLQRF